MTSSGKTKPWSLRRRLVFGFGASCIVLLAATLAVVYALLVRGFEAEHNAILVDRIDAVEALLKSPAHGLQEIHLRVESEWPKREGEKVFIRVVGADAQTIAETPGFPSLIGSYLPIDIRDWKPSPQTPRIQELDAPSGFAGRYKIEENAAELHGPVLIMAYISKEQSGDFLARFRQVSLLVLAAGLLAGVGIGWQMAREGMRPIQSITRTVGNISSDNLHERVDSSNLPDELQGLASAFNRSLNRIEESFQRLSQFSADIAHELRTPITNMMGEIEVALGRPREASEYIDILTSNLEECERLHRMVESMLFLARTENFGYEVHAKSLNLRQELENILEFFEPAASEKQIRLKLQDGMDSKLAVLVEPMLFQRAIGNLISNAIRYTPPSGEVTIRFSSEENMVAVEVRDTGVGIPENHLSKVFERFYRVDDSRSLNSGGFGLGLAIVKSIVLVHGGRVSVQSELGHGTTFRTEWPRALDT